METLRVPLAVAISKMETLWVSSCRSNKYTGNIKGILLQAVLAKNYPKVRKGLYVFPINWWVIVVFLLAVRAHTQTLLSRAYRDVAAATWCKSIGEIAAKSAAVGGAETQNGTRS